MSLASASAWSKSSARTTVSSGPKISSVATVRAGRRATTTDRPDVPAAVGNVVALDNDVALLVRERLGTR